ncbi:MAG: hypothetical protein JXA14_07385 [Anaerolineae bacterium]|jgi:hypothetical protein|nr:hypothetical protein [Anaerolineae bacterium]
MAKLSAKRRQKKLQRQAAKRKAKQRAVACAPKGRRAQLRASASWPLHECLLTKAWQDTSKIVQILAARRSPAGQVAIGAFLVDLGCLGVKAAFGRLLDTEREYKELRDNMKSRQEMIKADPDLAAKIIREAIAYAKDLGFRPDPDYRDAMLVLGDANPDACGTPIPLGKDGKPFFIPGPDDKVNLIMAKLTRKLGPDGFDYFVPLDEDMVQLEE